MDKISITVTGNIEEIEAVLNAVRGMNTATAGPLAVATLPAMHPQIPAALAPVVAPLLDSTGLPWDARINTSNKAQTKHGVWKRVPGITDDVYNATLAELRGSAGAPTIPTTPPAVSAASAPAASAVIAPATAPVVPTIPVTPAAPAAPLGGPVPGVVFPPAPGMTPVPVEERVPSSFPELLSSIGAQTVRGKITADEIGSICKKYGLATLADANTQVHLIPILYKDMADIWNTRA